MRITTTAGFGAAALMVLWAAAAAQTATPPAAASPPQAAVPAPSGALVGPADFISPVGEPFRSTDALSGAEHWFQRADANHDGKLTRAEFVLDSRSFFRQLDLDHNGEIGSTEIDHYESEVAPEIRVTSTGFDYAPSDDDSNTQKPEYPDRLGAGRLSYIDLPEPITSMDQNFNGLISAAEFDAAALRRFAALDANGDGVITRDELPRLKEPEEGPKRHHKNRKAGPGEHRGHGGFGQHASGIDQ